MVFGTNTETPQVPTLTAFLRNFCDTTPGPLARRRHARAQHDGPARRLLHPRRAVRLDRRPVHATCSKARASSPAKTANTRARRRASSHFLKAELQRLAPARKAGQRAVIIACHHPPASVDGKHGGSYRARRRHRQRRRKPPASGPTLSSPATPTSTSASPAASTGARSRTSSPAAAASPRQPPIGGLRAAPVTVGEYTLVAPPIVEFGYLRVGVDMSGPTPLLTIDFHDRTSTTVHDSVTLDLASGTIK